eukprot:1154910-Pelagomonas_calceolata.AAC.4
MEEPRKEKSKPAKRPRAWRKGSLHSKLARVSPNRLKSNGGRRNKRKAKCLIVLPPNFHYVQVSYVAVYTCAGIVSCLIFTLTIDSLEQWGSALSTPGAQAKTAGMGAGQQTDQSSGAPGPGAVQVTAGGGEQGRNQQDLQQQSECAFSTKLSQVWQAMEQHRPVLLLILKSAATGEEQVRELEDFQVQRSVSMCVCARVRVCQFLFGLQSTEKAGSSVIGRRSRKEGHVCKALREGGEGGKLSVEVHRKREQVQTCVAATVVVLIVALRRGLLGLLLCCCMPGKVPFDAYLAMLQEFDFLSILESSRGGQLHPRNRHVFTCSQHRCAQTWDMLFWLHNVSKAQLSQVGCTC